MPTATTPPDLKSEDDQTVDRLQKLMMSNAPEGKPLDDGAVAEEGDDDDDEDDDAHGEEGTGNGGEWEFGIGCV